MNCHHTHIGLVCSINDKSNCTTTPAARVIFIESLREKTHYSVNFNSTPFFHERQTLILVILTHAKCDVEHFIWRIDYMKLWRFFPPRRRMLIFYHLMSFLYINMKNEHYSPRRDIYPKSQNAEVRPLEEKGELLKFTEY